MRLSAKQARECGLGVPQLRRKRSATEGDRKAKEKALTALAQAHGLPVPVFEYHFGEAIGRKWRFDLCWPECDLALEIQGGLFSRGRHVRGAALLNEYEKLNHAVLLGWTIVFFTPQQIENGSAFAFVRQILSSCPPLE